MKVPGRKRRVRIETVFVRDLLSLRDSFNKFLVSVRISLEVLLSLCASLKSLLVMRVSSAATLLNA
jgi:hypothetical protein